MKFIVHTKICTNENYLLYARRGEIAQIETVTHTKIMVVMNIIISVVGVPGNVDRFKVRMAERDWGKS